MARSKRKEIDKLLTSLGMVVTLVLLVFGGLALWAYTFTAANVHEQLSAQKIYFPEKGSEALEDPQIKPHLEKYAGQQLTTGPQAKAYADHFIKVHLQKIGGGQTYAEVSAKAQKDPGNAELQQQAQALFKGETLRGLLLGNAYAFSVIGQIALAASIIAFAGAALMTVFVLLGVWHMSTLR